MLRARTITSESKSAWKRGTVMIPATRNGMVIIGQALIQTVLNRIENFKSFIFGDVRIEPIHGEHWSLRSCLARTENRNVLPVVGNIRRMIRALDLQSILPVCASSGELSDGWGFGGMDASGDRKRTDDPPVQKHSGPVGPELVLE